MLVSIQQLNREINQSFVEVENLERDIQIENRGIDDNISEEKRILKQITKDNILGISENISMRKAMLDSKAIEPLDFAFERAIGKNDSLYSNFVDLIAQTKNKVGRIVIKIDNKKIGYATGFMVSEDLLLTNWHVFNNESDAKDSEVHFFYEYDANGHPRTPIIFKFDTSKFFNNKDLDYCFVGVQPKDISGKISLNSFGYLFLDKSLGKLGDVKVERLNIIHHPLGDYKQLSIRENLFVDIDETKIYYETDTAQGSSGSPVFNDQWQVVALHHKSVPLMSKDGKDYLDKDGNVIPIIDGKIDSAKIVWLKNEGIRISVILNHIKEVFGNEPALLSISKPPKPFTTTFAVPQDSSLSNNISVSVPAEFLHNEEGVDINISVNKKIPKNNILLESFGDNQQDLLFEASKISKEQDKDFSECKGYDPSFLGVKVLLPKPKKKILKEIATLINNPKEYELKYYNYSVIFNAVRKMPLISAVNVEGSKDLRLDNSKRNDDWLRDVRIDLDCQLTDKFYKKSDFDKGHMARFEDANWGKTAEIANQNGVYTCFYTNACPQKPDLNRKGENAWGRLEKAILEKGIKKETGNQARITVFNGPIFDNVVDKVYRGIYIPMSFFKIVLWFNDNNQLKATAFRLSQEHLEGGFKDEKLEAIDIDQNVDFKAYQCSIKSLNTKTNIDFRAIEKFDTFNMQNIENELFIGNETKIVW